MFFSRKNGIKFMIEINIFSKMGVLGFHTVCAAQVTFTSHANAIKSKYHFVGCSFAFRQFFEIFSNFVLNFFDILSFFSNDLRIKVFFKFFYYAKICQIKKGKIFSKIQ